MFTVRVQHTSVRNVKSGDVELLKHNFCHSLSIRSRIPSGFRYQRGMFGGGATHDFLQSVLNQWRDGVKILDF